jgi:hypothetical protein
VKLLIAILFCASGAGCLIVVLLSWQLRRTTRTELERARNRRDENEAHLLDAAALLQAWVESHPEQMAVSRKTRSLLADIKSDLAVAEEELC